MFNLVPGTSVDPPAEDITVQNNVLEGCGYGVHIEGDVSNSLIKGNEIRDNGFGIRQTSVDTDLGLFVPEENVAHANDISGNDTGVQNEGGGSFDATNNYWGHASGPGGPDGRTNPAGKTVGKGDGIVGDVEFSSWKRRPFAHPSRK